MQYYTLPNDVLRAIYRNVCYGSRIEYFSPKQVVLENGVYVIDGVWMFASCLSHLPTGPCEHDFKNELAIRSNGYRCPGFYYVTATVPHDWRHIGLLKEWKETYREGEDSRYPNEPGETFTSWCTADELVLALNNPLNIPWKITIHERYYFPEELKDPFDNWYRKLKDLRYRASQGKTKVDGLLKGAYRNIVLHTIGSFKQGWTWIDHTDIPDEQFKELEKTGRIVQRYPRRKAGVMSCKEEIPLHRDRQPFVRPEWAATVWGKARARLAEFALQLPYEDIVRFATDSVWCASVPSGVHKKSEWNKPGEFVVKDDTLSGKLWEWPIDSGKMREYVIWYNAKHNNPDELVPADSFYSDEEEQ